MGMQTRPANAGNTKAMCSVVLLGFGMHCILRGIVLPAIKAELGITFTQSATLLASSTVGYLVMAMLAGKLAEKLGQRTSLSIYAGGQAFMAVCIALSGSTMGLTVFFFFTGACYGGIECIVTAIVKRYNPQNSGIVMNQVFSFYCVGCLVIALLGGWFVFSGIGWRPAFLVVAAVCLAGFVFTLFIKDGQSSEDSAVDLTQLKTLFSNRPFLISCLATLLMSGAETSTNNWLTTFLTAGADINIFQSSALAAMFYASVYFGRKFFIRIMRSRDAATITSLASLASGILVAAVSFVNDPRLLLVSIVAIGVAISPLYPSLISMTSGLAKEPLVYSFTFVSISLGNLGVNYMMGAVADWLGIRSTFRFNAVIFLIVTGLVIINRHHYAAKEASA